MPLRKGAHRQERGVHQVHPEPLRQGGRPRRGIKRPRHHVTLATRRHELVPKFHKFTYRLGKYSEHGEPIVYSEAERVNGIEWRLKIYPRGNGVAKGTHLSVFLELFKGYENHNKYDYKIELVNFLNAKESIVR